MKNSLNLIILNLFFTGQLLALFYGFQEISRLKTEILVLNQNLVLRTEQVVQLTSLLEKIEKHVVTSPKVDPSYAS